MADRAITALTAATTMSDEDLFVISQGGQAKKVTWQVFYQYLAETEWAHGGIRGIEYTPPESGSLNGTVTVTFGDNTTTSFTITNGKGISSITKTAAVPPSLTDSYRMLFNDNTYYDFTVDNGKGISSIAKTAAVAPSLTDTYTVTYNDGTTYTFTVDNGKSIASIADKWAVSDSNSTEPSTWYDAVQTMTPVNKYLWHYEVITFNDSTTVNTAKSVVGVYGDTGEPWYVWIKYSSAQPTQDSDMSDNPDNWIGVYSGTASTAPTTYTSYAWFEYKGEKGDTGTSIVSVTKTGTSGLEDTYTVLFSNGTSTTFTVTNGSSIQSIAKTGTSGLVDTYTVTLTNGNTTTFTVTNGKGITSITEVDVTHAAGHTDVYRINFNDGDSYTFSVYNGTNGSGSVSTVDGIQSVNQDVPLLTFGSGAPTTATVGAVKSRYFDTANSMLYICTGIDTSGAETTYTWQGTSVTVDSVLSSMSTNPVQNRVLAGILGTIAQYDSTASYAVGDYCIYQNQWYVCNTAIAVGGETWDAQHWTQKSMVGSVDALDRKMGNTALPTTAQTVTGAIAEVNTKVGSGSLPGFTATDLTGAANELRTSLSTYVRPNLLDNWYFGNPVNQRGQSSYSGTGYGIDRWKSDNSSFTLTIGSSGITLGHTFSFFQMHDINSFLGKKVTLSCLATVNNEDVIAYVTADIPNDYSSNLNQVVAIGDTTFNLAIWISGGSPYLKPRIYQTTNANASLLVKAVKLELGSTQTLAHLEGSTWVLNEIPDYDEQLFRCRTSTADSSDAYANRKQTSYDLTFQLSGSNSTKTITFPNAFKGVIYVSSASSNCRGAMIVNVSTAGAVTYTSLGSISNLTITTGTNTMSINDRESTYPQIGVYMFSVTAMPTLT